MRFSAHPCEGELYGRAAAQEQRVQFCVLDQELLTAPLNVLLE
jgi:hypothetical protein